MVRLRACRNLGLTTHIQSEISLIVTPQARNSFVPISSLGGGKSWSAETDPRDRSGAGANSHWQDATLKESAKSR